MGRWTDSDGLHLLATTLTKEYRKESEREKRLTAPTESHHCHYQDTKHKTQDARHKKATAPRGPQVARLSRGGLTVPAFCFRVLGWASAESSSHYYETLLLCYSDAAQVVRRPTRRRFATHAHAQQRLDWAAILDADKVTWRPVQSIAFDYIYRWSETALFRLLGWARRMKKCRETRRSYRGPTALVTNHKMPPAPSPVFLNTQSQLTDSLKYSSSFFSPSVWMRPIFMTLTLSSTV